MVRDQIRFMLDRVLHFAINSKFVTNTSKTISVRIMHIDVLD